MHQEQIVFPHLPKLGIHPFQNHWTKEIQYDMNMGVKLLISQLEIEPIFHQGKYKPCN